MKAAQRRTWRVGDRFTVNRWSEADSEPLVFEVTARRPKFLYFWCPALDQTTGGRRARRRIPYTQFYRQIAQRFLVRVEAR